jgi:hypothetical protein
VNYFFKHSPLVLFGSVIRMIKRRRMRLAEYVARMGENEWIKDSGGKAIRKETIWKT